jgi:asparagine synthase (glutamine-hydrolysing)
MHRGPDYSSIEIRQNGIKIGHTRLSITDPDERSNQPFVSASGNHTIIFNGEIYNYEALRKEEDLNWRTNGDTEVIVELYEKKGASFLDELIGMFVILIINNISGEIFVARDRLGVKPLYFRKSKNFLTFGSETSIFHELYDDLTPSLSAIEQYKNLRTTFNGETFYNEVAEFPAGHFFEGGKFKKYWDLEYPNMQEVDEKLFLDIFQSAVEMRKPKDVDYGSFLSGGIDSALLTKASNARHTWCVGMENMNEFSEATENSNEIGTNHKNILVSNELFIETLVAMVKKRKEPLSVPNEVLLYLLSKEISKEVKVVFSGEGADELFAGYDRIFGWAANIKRFNIDEFASMYSYTKNVNFEVIESSIEPFLHFQDPYLIVSAFFQKFHLAGLLKRLDHATMLAGVESRNPFVDHRLVELMFGVPYGQKSNNGLLPKFLLREVSKNFLPKSVRMRPKVGFPVPVQDIFGLEQGLGRKNEYDYWLNRNLKILNWDGV